MAAREFANEKSITNVTFFNDSILDIKHLGRYDFVTCMGVLSGIVSEARFARSLYALKSLIKPKGGKLLLKESVSNGNPVYTPHDSAYTCVYRNYDQYINTITDLGFELMEEVKLSRDENNGLVNHLFLFKLK